MSDPKKAGENAYTAAVDLLASLVLEAYRRDPAVVLARVRRKAEEETEALLRADLEAEEETEADRETRRQIAALFGCRPDEVVQIR